MTGRGKGPWPHTHLPQGPGQAVELVGCVDGHHGHGGRCDGPPQRIGPLGENVVSVVRGPEGHDADHDHKLKARAEVMQRYLAGRQGQGCGHRGSMEPESQGSGSPSHHSSRDASPVNQGTQAVGLLLQLPCES